MAEHKEFDQHLIQLIIGLQSTAWMALGKQMNPQTGKQEVNLDVARDSIDTLLMLKEKTKGNTTQAEDTIFKNAMQDLELNFIEVSSKQEKNKEAEQTENKEAKQEGKKEENNKEKNTDKEQKAAKEEKNETKNT